MQKKYEPLKYLLYRTTLDDKLCFIVMTLLAIVGIGGITLTLQSWDCQATGKEQFEARREEEEKEREKELERKRKTEPVYRYANNLQLAY